MRKMKAHKLGSLTLIIAVLAVCIFAQDKPKAKLFHQFSYPDEKVVETSLNGFFERLKSDPASQGYILTSGNPNRVDRNVGIFEKHIKLRKFDTQRVVIRENPNKKCAFTQFWIVPEGAEPPTFEKQSFADNSGCKCPAVSVSGPAAASGPGENMVFFASVSGIDRGIVSFKWLVNRGKIIEGQGTDRVTVSTEGLESGPVNASVTIVGTCPDCQNKFSDSGLVLAEIQPILVDRFRHSNCEEFLARLDQFFNELNQDPSSVGYLLAYGQDRAVARARMQLNSWIKMRNFDGSRITFVTAGKGGKKADIDLWRVPAGADASKIPTRDDITVVPESKPTIPYIFTRDAIDGVGGCSDYDPDGFAAALKKNRSARGNIVIYESSRANFRDVEKMILKRLTGQGVFRKRLRTFYVRIPFGEMREGIELWFLP